MRAFEVYLDGQKLCTAGIDDGVVTVIVNSVSRLSDQDLFFSMVGSLAG